MESSSPLVGRESELEFLMGHMSRAISGSGALTLIAGEAGCGKTTLCEALERMAVQSGCLVLVGRCVPGPQIPYLPFMEALHGRAGDPFATPDATDQGGKLLLSVLSAVEALSAQRPLILRIEDLHWADSASIGLLHFLARNIRRSGVLIVGTYRPEDLRPSVNGEAHLLREHLPIMRREGLLRELELELLGPQETRRIVDLRLVGPAEERLKDHIANESRGNPLFAIEMLRYLDGSGQIVYEHGIWRLHLDREQQAPTTVREVILARIDHLLQENRRVLEAAAVIGERFEPELIDSIYHVDRTQLLENLHALEYDHRLVLAEGEGYRFSHEKVRQVVYESISRPRRKELHRLIGLQLERRLPNEELLGPLSEHFLKAGDKKSIGYALAAGKLCQRRKAVREAKTFFLTILEQTEDDDRVPDRLEALESLGDLKNDVSSPKEWYSYYERFLALNRDRRARARVLAKAAECWDPSYLGDGSKGRELLDEAEALADGDPRILAEIAYRRADLSATDGQIEEALSHIATARRHYEDLGDQAGTLMSRELETLILLNANRLKEARELAEEQLLLARGLEDPEPRLMIGMMAGVVCSMMGDTPSAMAHTTEVIDLASKLGMMWTLRLALRSRAVAHELEGDLEGARMYATQALENAREYENGFQVAKCESYLGLYEAELGDLESAERHYEEAEQAASAFGTHVRLFLDVDLSTLRAELLARRGGFQESDEIYAQLIERTQDSGQRYEALNSCVRHAMSLARRGRGAEAREQFEKAMELATDMGCERRVTAFGRRAGIYT